MNDCFFCKIAQGTIPSATLMETNEFRVILDKFPSGKGHTLIMPKEHFNDIYELDSETAGKLFALATVVARALKKITGCEGLNVIQNNGSIAGQTIMHFHLHLIPRHEGDGMDFTWPTSEMSDEDLEALAAEIAKEI